MNRNGHLATVAMGAAGVSWQFEQPLWQRAASAVLALATAMAPDVDNTRWWQEIRQHIPIKQVRKALNHRRLTHSWMIVVALWYAQDEPGWAYVALLAGYGWHIFWDGIFGKGGVPVILWFLPFGLQLPMGKRLENLVTVLATAYTPFVICLGPVTPAHVVLLAVSMLITTPLGIVALLGFVGFLIFVTRSRRPSKREERKAVH